MSDLDKAREWARDNINDFYEDESAYAVCEVIQSLPDQWIDAEKLRETINEHLLSYPHGSIGHTVAEDLACKMQALLSPPLPTLADMTPEEREQCRGMWCDYRTVNGDLAQLVYRGQKSGLASVHDPKTQDERTNFLVMAQSVTPRFDLMRAWNPDGTPSREVTDE